MIIVLLFFALATAFAAAVIVSLMGFSFWIAFATYTFVGTLALIFGAAFLALYKTTGRRSDREKHPPITQKSNRTQDDRPPSRPT